MVIFVCLFIHDGLLLENRQTINIKSKFYNLIIN